MTPHRVLIVAVLAAVAGSRAARADELIYAKKATRAATQSAVVQANLGVTLSGAWRLIGPFDAHGGRGMDEAYPPELSLNLDAQLTTAVGDQPWTEVKLPDGKVHKLNRQFAERDDRICFLYRRIEVPAAGTLRVSLGFDDGLAVYVNGRRVLVRKAADGASADQEFASLPLRAGGNDVLLKLYNRDKDWAFYFQPTLSEAALAELERRLDEDFPPTGEAAHYRLERIPLPDDELIEVGGLAFRPDGKLYVATRRGDVWLVHNPLSAVPSEVRWQRFATGLHEALGLAVGGPHEVYLAQRPELTLLRDVDDDGSADEFVTVCDRFGVTGDYHEFHYGPARSAAGDLYLALNLSLASSHFSRAPYRGYVMRVSPQGLMTPVANGLRSPNGLGLDPQGRLFCTDNQGEWIPACKLQEVRSGEYYGHPASVRWTQGDDAPPPSMTPPAVWFPFGTCRSATEPVWDVTAGRFGPFAGHCFVGELTNALVLRVMLEEVGGRLQGACVQFRKGFGSGVNRLAFAPDGSLVVGQTNRGWGSLGGRPHGLDRLVFTGRTPLEVLSWRVTRDGWRLEFTAPVNADGAGLAKNYLIDSYRYHHWDKYGSPEIDRRSSEVAAAEVSDDGRTVTLRSEHEIGRVYRLRLENLSAVDGAPVLHRELFYTLNALP